MLRCYLSAGRGDSVTEHPGDQYLENEIDADDEDQDVDSRVECLNDALVEDGMLEDEARNRRGASRLPRPRAKEPAPTGRGGR